MGNENLKLKIVAETKLGEQYYSPENALEIAGAAASLCYDENTNSSLAKYLTESKDEKIRRGKAMINVGHGSPLEHYNVSFVLENISKIQSIILNNQRVYSLTERSFRYTKPSSVNSYYEKWFNILIENNFSKKIAKENARYMISLFDKISTGYYTMNIRQINVLLRMLKEKIDEYPSALPIFDIYIVNELKELYDTLSIFDLGIQKNKYQKLNLFDERKSAKSSYIHGDIYGVYSHISAVGLGQIQRHRTIHYFISPNKSKYYIPKCIRDIAMVNEWLSDLRKVFYPNAICFNVFEEGFVSDFMMKYDIRNKPQVQEEVFLQVNKVKDKLVELVKFDNLQNTDSGKLLLS